MNQVLIERSSGGIAVVTLNQPERLNALGDDTAVEFRSTIRALREDSTLRVVVFTGAGRAFSSGGHLEMLEAKTQRPPHEVEQEMRAFYGAFLCLRTLSVPTIAAINGHAIGAGLGIAAACDLRFAAASAKLSANFVRLGLHPGMGTSYFLPKLMGQTRAQEWLLTGKMYTAQQAFEAGLLHAVLPDAEVLSHAIKEAGEMAEFSAEAVTELVETLRGNPAELDHALAREAMCQARDFSGDAVRRALERLRVR